MSKFWIRLDQEQLREYYPDIYNEVLDQAPEKHWYVTFEMKGEDLNYEITNEEPEKWVPAPLCRPKLQRTFSFQEDEEPESESDIPGLEKIPSNLDDSTKKET